MFQEYNMVRN